MEKGGLSRSFFVCYVFLAFFVFVIIFSGSVLSLQENMCVNAEVTSVKPVSVDAGEDFTVGVQIDNCGEEIPENVTFKITRHSKNIEIKEPLSTYIGELGYSNSKRFLTYHMYVKPEASPGTHNFETKVIYGDEELNIEKEDNFTVTVESEKPDLAISGISTNPETIYNGDKVILTVDVENSGEGEAEDVRAGVNNLELRGTRNAYLGEVESEENLPARFVLEASEAGMYKGSVNISYEKYGNIKEIKYPFEIQVFDKDYTSYWVGGIIAVLIIALLVFRQIYSK